MIALIYIAFIFPSAAITQPFIDPSITNKELSVLSPHITQINQRFEDSSSLVNHILNTLRKYALPPSFVLVPMLESSYNPDAISHANAGGLWQMIPTTAIRFGLDVSPHNDQRFDAYASTDAAIKYLSFLYTKFEEDLALTLAAYNAGEGRVARAIKEANSTTFNDLSLPQETRQYVHRFYALQELVDVHALKKNTVISMFLFATSPRVSNKQFSTMKPLIELKSRPPLITL